MTKEKHSIKLGWALLAYCANGPDLLLSLAARRYGVLAVADALVDFAQHTASHQSEFIALAAKAPITLLVRSALSSHGLDFTAHFPHYEKSLRSWVERLHTWQALSKDDDIERVMTHNERYRLIYPGDPLWPIQVEDLPEKTGAPAPLCLWIDGDATILAQYRYAAIVGSRDSTSYGSQCARQLASRLSRHGIGVVSGGALGIDASAHDGCIGSGGAPTVAVFAGGLDHIGPASNLGLFERILHSGGALISEVPPDTIPYASRFLERNRLIAALSNCIVVAQARWKSGALNTAHWGAQLLRTVLAIPGPITEAGSAGCNRLIADSKASLLLSIDDIDSFIHPADITADSGKATTTATNQMCQRENRHQHNQSSARALPDAARSPQLPLASEIMDYLQRHGQVTASALIDALAKQQPPSFSNAINKPSEGIPNDSNASSDAPSDTPSVGLDISVIRIKRILGALELEGKITHTPDGRILYAHRT